MPRFLLALCLAFALVARAEAQTPPPEVAAKIYLVQDLTSNQTLAQREADTPTDPASLTKLMTAYVVLAALKEKKISLEQQLQVSEMA
jgi:D-alanyl-D-alanine carboxypeptidase (penicillin-binding protein 5/6)